MISARAKAGFDQMVTQGIRAGLLSPGASPQAITSMDSLKDLRETHAVILSISSYLFRLMVLIYFTPDEATRAHFARIHRMAPEEMTEQAFADAIAECGNMCCGTVNRELGRVFPHVGMSTPNIVDRRCAEHLHLTGYGHLQHFQVSVDDDTRFHVTLCVCDDEDLDFETAPEQAPESTGELEFF